MAKRSHAREVAFQVIYQDDLNPRTNAALMDAFISERISSEGLAEFAKSLVAGARRNRPEIDDALNETADNWTLDRMAANGIEIATTEMVVFEWLKQAGTDAFRELSALIK